MPVSELAFPESLLKTPDLRFPFSEGSTQKEAKKRCRQEQPSLRSSRTSTH